MSEEDTQIPLVDALKLVHENSRQNIESCKNRQWHVTNYALVAQAAIVAGAAELAKRTGLQFLTCAGMLLLIAVAFGASVLLAKLQQTQQAERKIIERIRRDHMPNTALDILGEKQRPNFGGFWYHGDVLAMLYTVVAVATGIGILLILTQ